MLNSIMVINNQFDNIHLKSNSLLECFDNVDWEKKISLSMWVNKYASIVHSSKVDYEIETNQENWESDFFFLCLINENNPSSIRLKFKIKHSWVKLNVHIVALVSEDAPVTIDADIFMEEWIQWSSASLLEESILLSPKVNIRSLPVLDIHAKNIQASHWAKIYRLDDDKLFYLESKWLNKNQAEKLILSSFWERLFDLVDVNEEEKEWILNKFFTYC